MGEGGVSVFGVRVEGGLSCVFACVKEEGGWRSV